jgi:hypothetical protein
MLLPGQNVAFTVSNIITSPSIMPVSAFNLQVQTYGYMRMYGIFTINVVPNIITNITLLPTLYAAALPNMYTLTFTINSNSGIAAGGLVRVYLPNNITIPTNISSTYNSTVLTTNILTSTNCL